VEEFVHQTDAMLDASDGKVNGPYDFVYVDSERVGALYSQLEPEMIETERTVKKDRGASGKGSATVGPLSGEVEGKNETAESSSYKPAQSSMQRKCVEVMRFLDSKGRIQHYSSSQHWFYKRTIKETAQKIHRLRESPLTEENLSQVREPSTEERVKE
jgi:hypothetical protein